MADRGRLRQPDGFEAVLRRELRRHVSYANVLAEDVERAWSELSGLAAAGAADAVEPSASLEARKAAVRRRRALLRARSQLLMLLRAHGFQSERIADLAVKLRRWRSDAAPRAAPRLSIVA